MGPEQIVEKTKNCLVSNFRQKKNFLKPNILLTSFGLIKFKVEIIINYEKCTHLIAMGT